MNHIMYEECVEDVKLAQAVVEYYQGELAESKAKLENLSSSEDSYNEFSGVDVKSETLEDIWFFAIRLHTAERELAKTQARVDKILAEEEELAF